MSNSSFFEKIKVTKPKYSSFDLSHDVKLTGSMGQLIPFLCEPTVPGDKFSIKSDILVRFAPLLYPMLSSVDIYTHFFFVPNRLIWDGWTAFYSAEKKKTRVNGELVEQDVPVYPRFVIRNNVSGVPYSDVVCESSLLDYLGFPCFSSNENYPNSIKDFNIGSGNHKIELDALPFRAYQLIYNEYYRDQNLCEEIDIMKDVDGVIEYDARCHKLMELRRRAWRKDYFTSALPWPQRGDDVLLPIGGILNVESDGNWHGVEMRDLQAYSSERDSMHQYLTGPLVSGRNEDHAGIDIGFPNVYVDSDGRGIDASFPDSQKATLEGTLNSSQVSQGLFVDGGKLSSSTINEFRRSVAAQKFLEQEARSGGRFIEMLKGFFGVNSSDARLQRPEYLGGGRTPLVISEVLQTSQTTESSPQGTPSGNGISLGSHGCYNKYFEEPGYVVGIMSVIPKADYQQGYPRKYRKYDRYDYYFPQFAHLGEQDIKSEELYFDPTASDEQNNKTFGYTPRYAEYKYIPNRVCGDFRTNMSRWHLGRIFGNRPLLNQSFIDCKPSDRVFAVEDDGIDKLWVEIHNDMKARRLMPYFGTPSM